MPSWSSLTGQYAYRPPPTPQLQCQQLAHPQSVRPLEKGKSPCTVEAQKTGDRHERLGRSMLAPPTPVSHPDARFGNSSMSRAIPQAKQLLVSSAQATRGVVGPLPISQASGSPTQRTSRFNPSRTGTGVQANLLRPPASSMGRMPRQFIPARTSSGSLNITGGNQRRRFVSGS